MIVYNRLWQTLKEKNISQYQLIYKYGLSTGQVSRLRNNETVKTSTIDELCKILNCKVEDIMEYRETM